MIAELVILKYMLNLEDSICFKFKSLILFQI